MPYIYSLQALGGPGRSAARVCVNAPDRRGANMVDNETHLIEVVFKIPPEEDLGFPAEWVWAEPLDANTFRLHNQPVYANGYAYRDVVEAEETEGGFQVMRPRDRSGYSAVRIYPPV